MSGATKAGTGDTPQLSKAEFLKNMREQEKQKAPAHKGPSDPVETDEHGIPFHELRTPGSGVLCGVVDGLMRWPLWTGKLYHGPGGEPRPKIILVPVSPDVNGGQGTAFYKTRKGFKEVSEIPDAYARFRDPYADAVKAWQAKEAKRAALRAQLEEAGVLKGKSGLTTTQSMRGVAGSGS